MMVSMIMIRTIAAGKGSIPKIDLFKDEICWCDIMGYYLLHVAGYQFYSTIHPYKGEVYTKDPAP